MSDMRKISNKYGSRKGTSFFNCRHVQKLNTIIRYVFKTQNFVKNYYLHFLEDNGCVEHGKTFFLLHNLEVECLLFFLMGFPVVGWDFKIKNVVLCRLSVDGSQSYLRE
jgi:hypothetical protein